MELIDNNPDYTEYSQKELEDTLAHIDKEAYPERAQQILQEIVSRKVDSAEQKGEFVPLVEELHSNWFIRYWLGHVSLPMSYWGVGLATTLLIYTTNFLVQQKIEAATATWQLGAYILALHAFVLIVVTWQSVGLLRTARKHPLRTGDTGWASIAIFMLSIGLLSFSFTMYKTGFPAIKSGTELLLGLTNYNATEFRVLNNGKDLELIGHIDIGSNEQLKEQLALHPDVNRLHLHSQGGRILAAKRMLVTIKQHNLETYVKTECASACTLLFIAGENRLLADGGQLKFHAPGLGGTSAHEIVELGSSLKNAYEDEKVPTWFIEQVMRTPHDSFWVPTQKELLRANIVNKVVDSSNYPMSGLGPGSAITSEEIELGLLTLDYMVAMKQYDPEAYKRAVEINLKGMKAGKSKNEISVEFRNLLYEERLPVYLSTASNDAIVQYWRAQIAHMKALRKDFPLACASLSYPEEVPEENRYGNEGSISDEQQASEFAAIAFLIRTSQGQYAKMEKSTQQELIQKILSIVRDKNEEFIHVISSAKDYIDQPRLLCDASIALNEAFVSFDVATSGQLLRSL